MAKSNSLKHIGKHEQPYEKCMAFGVNSLTDAELLAILLRTGTKGLNSIELAREILYKADDETGLLSLHTWSLEQLMTVKGIGKVKAIQILSLLEFAKRLSKACATESLVFSSPASIAKYYMEDFRHKQQEYMTLLMLNTKSKLIAETVLSKGTVNASLVSPRELFIEALKREAVFVIIMHNHPSGDPTPSSEDISITKRIQTAGKILGIELLDHIVIGDNCYISLREQGMI